MAKVIFVLHRLPELSIEQVKEHWSGESHLSKVRQLPGLTRFVQNYIVSAPGEPVCDGIGELYFESDEAMQEALQSPQMGAAVESAQTFLDMERTGLIIVSEATVFEAGVGMPN